MKKTSKLPISIFVFNRLMTCVPIICGPHRFEGVSQPSGYTITYLKYDLIVQFLVGV